VSQDEAPEQIAPQEPLPEQEPKQVDGEQTPGEPRLIHLPALLSDEFGHSTSEIRMQIALGTVEIDGEEWKGDSFNLPYDEILGKTITVKGRDRGYRVTYRG
jgi:hypothetical protein